VIVSATEQASYRSGQFLLARLALGFGFGRFFDGILLHQVIQWYHCLSGLEETRRDMRVLIMTDGLFHLLLSALSALGLWLMRSMRWRLYMPSTGASSARMLQGSFERSMFQMVAVQVGVICTGRCGLPARCFPQAASRGSRPRPPAASWVPENSTFVDGDREFKRSRNIRAPARLRMTIAL
jgi:uncharacterized membrane protein